MLKIRDKKISYVPLYPSENYDGIILSEKEILKLTKSLSFIYEDIVNEIVNKLSTQKKIPVKSLKIIIRTSIIPIIYIFFERFHRIHKAKKINLKVFRTNIMKIETPKKIEDFYENINEKNFNQIIINNIASIWDEEITPINNKKKNQQNYNSVNFINYVSYYDQTFCTRFNRKLENMFDFFLKSQKVPVSGLAQEENAFYKKGFFYLKFKKISLKVDKDIKKNSLKRDLFFDDLNLKFNKVNNFLKDYKLTIIEAKKTIATLNNFIKEMIPIDTFEGLTINYKNALNLIKPFQTRYVIFSGALNSERSFIAAAAKKMNKTLVFIQHGGHYGYIANLPRFSEFEYKVCDVFLTWGWSSKIAHENDNCLFKPLPSPWLSERKFFWKNVVNLDIEKKYDLLWMPQRLDKFTMPLTCIGNTRPDIIGLYSKEMINLMKLFKQKKITINYKPYNKETVHLLSNTHITIQNIAGALLNISKKIDKGLTKINIKNSHIILWDQPGTGFLECITSGIPTMVLISKLYAHPNNESKKFFRSLEKSGIIHKNPISLIDEIHKYKNNPKRWIENPERKDAIRNFSTRYALTDDNWVTAWNKYLQSLSSNE